jgi:hypothetical protein
MMRRRLFSCFCLFSLLGLVCAQTAFPEWRGRTTLLPGAWAASPIAAVGDVTNITSYGEQAVSGFPMQTWENVRRLYWCQGDFKSVAIIKGELTSPTGRYLWASSRPGCKLWDENPALIFSRFKTRVWLLREEGGFLRPTFDGGAPWFVGLFVSWDDLPSLPPRERLGTLLLTPLASSVNLEDYASYIWNVGDVACDLLGKAECARQIDQLGRLPSAAIRAAACDFLLGQLAQACGPQ